MGLEANCPVRIGAETFPGRVHLNTDRVEIRGHTRADIPFATVKSVDTSAQGALTIKHAGGRAVLELREKSTAEKWAEKIRSPKSLIDKLGVKPESRVAVLGVNDAEFSAKLQERLVSKTVAASARDLDFIFHAADTAAQLAQLKSLRGRLRSAGAIWVVSRKGKQATIRDADVMKAARAAGLVDNKVCSFSATHTALRLVIPRAER